MVACVECGKRLGFFEGHYHPTLGKKSLVCNLCLFKVEESVAQWRDFILSNSFNLVSSVRKRTSHEVALNHLNYQNNHAFIHSGRKTI